MTAVRVYLPSALVCLAAAADLPGASPALAGIAAGRMLPLITAKYAAAGRPDDEVTTAHRRALLEAATRPVVPAGRGPYRPRQTRRTA